MKLFHLGKKTKFGDDLLPWFRYNSTFTHVNRIKLEMLFFLENVEKKSLEKTYFLSLKISRNYLKNYLKKKVLFSKKVVEFFSIV